MKTYDTEQLTAQLAALAATFDRKPLTVEALKVWFDTLKEFPTHQVLGVLSSWAKHHGKMPAPSEVWKVVNEIGIQEREREAAQVKAEAKKVIDYPITEAGRRAGALMRKPQRRSRPIEHWLSVLQTAKRDSIGYRYAVEALAILKHKRREPGEDIEPTNPVAQKETAEAHSEIGWS